MRVFEALRALVASWFERAAPVEAREPRWQERSAAGGGLEAEEPRRSIRQVTLEQLGIAHWSCHTHF